jgi:hypothetical protein
MGDKRSDLRNDYFVVTKSYGRPKARWVWEIRRRSEPLGVKVYDDDFNSEQAAKLAGEKALKELLDRLCQEGNDV